MLSHINCRGGLYPFSKIARLPVPDELVSWSQEWSNYAPPQYTADVLKGKPWSDLSFSDPNFKPKWNALDGQVNRKSFVGDYCLDNDGVPLNPAGRTGIVGRGVLGRWGPNHAADPIVTRWKRNFSNTILTCEKTSKPILQFCAIQRKDNGQWAIPGGMVDPNEKVSVTLRREFLEEALNVMEVSIAEKKILTAQVMEFFTHGSEIYQGYVDDPRNTDNAWMETVVYNFHDETGDSVGKFALNAGDDAANVKWVDINCDLRLYASHSSFVKLVCETLGAHW